MKNISEYDLRQLKLMQKALISFESKQIDLHSLVGTLEFLFHALESVGDWGNKFFDEVSDLESINAIELIAINEGGSDKLEKDEKIVLIEESVLILKKIVEKALSDSN